MNLSERLEAFCSLGDAITNLSMSDSKALAEKARNENPWFTEENVLMALMGIRVILNKRKLTTWAQTYRPEPTESKTVGVVMAGNIPMVGFHDFLCVLISGHSLKAKLSSQDTILLKFIFQKLIEIEPRFSDRASFEENLKGVNAMIATGSDNTARYFEYYFRNIPHIIRKNRASCALIVGEEPKEEFELLGRDVFSYFGLGCRNVSKLYVPEDFEFKPLIESWKAFELVINHHKYANNYDYQKSILLVNCEPFLDCEFILLKESKSLISPIAMIYFEKYRSQQEVREKIEMHSDKLQVVVSAKGWFKDSVPFGQAQFPEVQDYADKVDIMNFLEGI